MCAKKRRLFPHYYHGYIVICAFAYALQDDHEKMMTRGGENDLGTNKGKEGICCEPFFGPSKRDDMETISR